MENENRNAIPAAEDLSAKTEKELLEIICEQNLRQTEILENQAKWSKRRTVIISVLMLAVAVVLMILSVQIGGMLEEANSAIGEITVLSHELNTILEESQIIELLNNANTLIGESGDALREALEGVDSALDTVSAIDIETLNKAISDLQKVIEPLARLFGR